VIPHRPAVLRLGAPTAAAPDGLTPGVKQQLDLALRIEVSVIGGIGGIDSMESRIPPEIPPRALLRCTPTALPDAGHKRDWRTTAPRFPIRDGDGYGSQD
jgi:hypothetical protein